MKLLFFLVALCLVMLTAYISVTQHASHKDNNTGTITITNGDYIEQLKWSGKIVLSEDENSIASIAPGGYLKFRENDVKMVAESNLQGDISYALYDGNQTLALNDTGKHFISASIKKMIARGFYAAGRAENINKKGGYHALIAALANLNMENIKTPYLELLLSNDSLSRLELVTVIRQTASSVNDIEKENFLKRITAVQRKDSIVSLACLDITAGMNSDIQKANILSLFIAHDSLTTPVFDRIMGISSRLNSDIDKQNIYHKLVEKKEITEEQFVQLIDAAAQQHSDIDKSNLLLLIAKKMPHTEKIKAAYLLAAKKINDDAGYGRTVKVIE